MKIPTSRGKSSLRQIVRLRSSSYDIARATSSKDAMGETVESTTTVTGVDLWLFQPGEVGVDLRYGEFQEGDLAGLALPSADIQVHDVVTHGGVDYEVDADPHLISEDEQTLKKITLVRRTA